MTNPLLLRAIRREPVERPPVWLMRQAGRYLSEYRELKEKHGFLGLCSNPELAAEITLQPVRILDVDAAIIFSDIVLPTSALGMEVAFNPGPVVKNPIRSAADISKIQRRELREEMGFVYEAIRLVRSTIGTSANGDRKAVIGFAGAPWTVAGYIIDQGPYKHLMGTSVFAKRERVAFHKLLGLLAEIITEHLIAQIEAGADVVQLFDTWGGNLSESDYREFCLPYTDQILGAVQKVAPTILYVGNSAHLLSAMAESSADCLSLDWRIELQAARKLLRGRTLQGNLDPAHLFASTQEVIAQTEAMLRIGAVERGYIANLGHGVLPGTPRENVLAFVDAVKGFRMSSSPTASRTDTAPGVGAL